jgi:insecticidal toxin complex protein TccC
VLSHIRYDAHARVISETAGNGVVTAFAYDPVEGRLTQRQDDNGRLQNLSYAFDPVGNVLSIEDLAQPVRHFSNQRIDPLRAFTYDTLYQLIEATGYEMSDGYHGPRAGRFCAFANADALSNYTQRYEYDAGGNLNTLIHVGAQGHTYRFATSALSNRTVRQTGDRPPSEAGIVACFDKCGGLRELAPGQALTWDARLQLSQVTSVERESELNDSEIYRYDSTGTRARKVRRTQARVLAHLSEVRYLPGLEIRTSTTTGEELHIVTVATGDGGVRALHWRGAPPENVANDQVRYSLSDHQGSCTLELDMNAGVISQEVYYPFGETAWFAGRNEIEATYKTVRYSGKERDATGLYDYGARYYAPWLMRWISPDPAGAVDGLNFYRFVRNNPSTFEDVMGMIPFDSFESEVERTRLKAIKAMEKARDLLTLEADEAVKQVMRLFFGSADPELKQRWKNDIEKTLEVAKATKARNFDLIKSKGDDGPSFAAEVDMAEYADFARFFAAKKRASSRDQTSTGMRREMANVRESYADERQAKFLKVGQRNWEKTRLATNANYMTGVLIHEFSHAAVNTRDFAYGKAKEGVDPTPLFQLPTDAVEISAPGADFRHSFSLTPTERAYQNADSFSGAIMFLKRAKSKTSSERALYRRYVESR